MHSPAASPIRRTRVIVADSDRIARQAIRERLEGAEHVRVIAEAADGVAVVELSVHYRPEVVLCAQDLPQLTGVEAMQRARDLAPEVAFIFLTGPCSTDEQWAYLVAGASGVLRTSISPEALIRAVTGVAAGEAAVSQEVTGEMAHRLRTMPESGEGTRPILSSLTTREWEVLDLLVAGHEPSAIAERLHVVEETVESHLKNAARKLGARSRVELIAEANRLCRHAPRQVAGLTQ